jgi:hypothetical protein
MSKTKERGDIIDYSFGSISIQTWLHAQGVQLPHFDGVRWPNDV